MEPQLPPNHTTASKAAQQQLDPSAPAPLPRFVSCANCRFDKKKCEGGQPCIRCKLANRACVPQIKSSGKKHKTLHAKFDYIPGASPSLDPTTENGQDTARPPSPLGPAIMAELYGWNEQRHVQGPDLGLPFPVGGQHVENMTCAGVPICGLGEPRCVLEDVNMADFDSIGAADPGALGIADHHGLEIKDPGIGDGAFKPEMLFEDASDPAWLDKMMALHHGSDDVVVDDEGRPVKYEPLRIYDPMADEELMQMTMRSFARGPSDLTAVGTTAAGSTRTYELQGDVAGPHRSNLLIVGGGAQQPEYTYANIESVSLGDNAAGRSNVNNPVPETMRKHMNSLHQTNFAYGLSRDDLRFVADELQVDPLGADLMNIGPMSRGGITATTATSAMQAESSLMAVDLNMRARFATERNFIDSIAREGAQYSPSYSELFKPTWTLFDNHWTTEPGMTAEQVVTSVRAGQLPPALTLASSGNFDPAFADKGLTREDFGDKKDDSRRGGE